MAEKDCAKESGKKQKRIKQLPFALNRKKEKIKRMKQM